MSYLVLARKYRPTTFKEVVGQDHITKTLINAFKKGRLSHAYLFAGPRGVGKTSTARILAKSFNCKNNQSGEPCNECVNCIEITNGSNLDVFPFGFSGSEPLLIQRYTLNSEVNT